MDVRTSIRGRLPSRQSTAGGLTNAELRHTAIGGEDRVSFAAAEIFKKTPYVADSKPRGRYVAKDRGEIGKMPLLETLNVKLTVAALVERKTKWKAGATNHTSGALGKYAQRVGPTVDGAVTHPGGAHEKQCYADI